MGIVLSYLTLLIYPNPFFDNVYKYRSFTIYSDRHISDNIEFVIDDVIIRVEQSELFHPSDTYKLYLCNDNWWFNLFSRNGNAGGAVNFVISGNIFIRENDIVSNQIIPPESWVFPLEDRPLSYFIAHETVHSLQRDQNRLLVLKAPVEIVEGYADYIAKGKVADKSSLIANFKNRSPRMNPTNGLYDQYHVYVFYLIDQKRFSIERIIDEQPDLHMTLLEMRKNIQ